MSSVSGRLRASTCSIPRFWTISRPAHPFLGLLMGVPDVRAQCVRSPRAAAAAPVRRFSAGAPPALSSWPHPHLAPHDHNLVRRLETLSIALRQRRFGARARAQLRPPLPSATARPHPQTCALVVPLPAARRWAFVWRLLRVAAGSEVLQVWPACTTQASVCACGPSVGIVVYLRASCGPCRVPRLLQTPWTPS